MTVDYGAFVNRVRETVKEVTPAELEARPPGTVEIIDVREAGEWGQGTIPGARWVARGALESQVALQFPDPDTEIVLCCSGGPRSLLAARALQEMGYRRVASLAGGVDRWKAEGRKWEVPVGLDADQRVRYGRHLVLPGIGEAGQERLLAARVLLVGAGGLGSPVVLYLAAAGVGTLGIVDFDQVDVTNLQRQVVHNLDRVGRPKVESAAETVRRLNPDVQVVAHPERLAAVNALEIMSGYDVVVDGADNFPARYLMNDASLHLRVPVVHGAVFRFEGQATVFRPYQGPCYRCLYPQPPPPELAPSCAEAGVLGALPGVIGAIEAVEAIKLLLGMGEPLVGRLLTYDSLTQEFRSLTVRRDPDCPACADPERVPVLVDYDDACRFGGSRER